MNKIILLPLLLIQLTLLAESFNVETLPYLRTREYPKQPYDKIVVFSASRTGSSLVYNIFRFLFEKEEFLSSPHNEFLLSRSVLKTHKIPEIEILKQTKENILYIIPIRDPLQASISIYRIQTGSIKNMQTLCKTLINRQVQYLNYIESLKKAGYSIAIIRYEDVEKDSCHHLFNFITNHFFLSISEQDMQMIKDGYSKENIYANIQLFSDFREVLPLSGFHGKHVSLEKFNPPKELLYWLNYYLEDFKPLFKSYGY